MLKMKGRRRASPSSVGSGAIWSGISTVVMRAANIAIMVIAVRLVSPKEFGVFTAALVVGTIATSISELGVASALMRRDLSVDELGPTVVAVAWTWCVGLAVLMVAAAQPFAALLGVPEAAAPIRILALGVVAAGFSSVPGALLAREFRQRSLFVANAVALIPSSLVLIVLALGGSGAVAFAWSRVVTASVAGVVMVVLGHRWIWPRLRTEALRVLLRFGVPLAGANVVGYALLNIDFVLVGRAMGPALLGVYSVAFSVASLSVSVLSSALNAVAMPAFSNHAEDWDRLRASVRRWGNGIFLVGVPVCGFTLAYSHEIIQVLYGPQWAGAAPVVAVLALYGVPMLIELMLSNLLVALGRTGAAFIVQCVWLVALSLGMLVGLGFLGLPGVAWAHVVVLVAAVLPVQIMFVGRVATGLLRNLWLDLIRPSLGTIAGVVLALAVTLPLASDWARLVVGGLVGAAVYYSVTSRAWRQQLLGVRRTVSATVGGA